MRIFANKPSWDALHQAWFADSHAASKPQKGANDYEHDPCRYSELQNMMDDEEMSGADRSAIRRTMDMLDRFKKIKPRHNWRGFSCPKSCPFRVHFERYDSTEFDTIVSSNDA